MTFIFLKKFVKSGSFTLAFLSLTNNFFGSNLDVTFTSNSLYIVRMSGRDSKNPFPLYKRIRREGAIRKV